MIWFELLEASCITTLSGDDLEMGETLACERRRVAGIGSPETHSRGRKGYLTSRPTPRDTKDEIFVQPTCKWGFPPSPMTI
jgi:hypothetical protein